MKVNRLSQISLLEQMRTPERALTHRHTQQFLIDSTQTLTLKPSQHTATQTAFVKSKNSIATSSAIHIHRPRVKDSLSNPGRTRTRDSGLSFRLQGIQQILCFGTEYLHSSAARLLIPTDHHWPFQELQPVCFPQVWYKFLARRLHIAPVLRITAIRMHLVY